VYDGATPSGNSIMAENLYYLSVVFDNAVWRQFANKILGALAPAILRHPTSFAIWASLLLKHTFGINELVITGNNFPALRNELLLKYLPEVILQSGTDGNSNFPMLKGKNPGNETLIYWCRQYSCNAPVNSVEKLMRQMKAGIKIET
jgi:uncharacterized protein